MAFLTAFAAGLLSTTAVLSTTPSPVTIKSCDVAYIDDSSDNNGIMTNSLELTNGVTLTVANTSSQVVTGFTVAGSYNTFHVTDTWGGKLRPGAQVTVYKHYQQLPYDDTIKPKCTITSATYADGTTWTGPAPAAM